MESPIATLMSKIFMDRLENEIFSSGLDIVNFVGFQFHYVDDVLCLWNDSLPQLDLTFKKTPRGQFEFELYRTPIHIDVTIDGASFHPPQHKLAASSSMIHHLISVPLFDQAFAKVVDPIKIIALSSNINLHVERTLQKKLTARILDATTHHTRNIKKVRWLCLSYLGRPPSHKISRILKNSYFRPAFYTVNNLKRLLAHLKGPTPVEDRRKVYSVSN